MKSKRLFRLAFLSVVTLGAWGCERDLDILEPASFPTDSGIYLGGFGPGIQFDAFGNSKVDALDIDLVERFRGEPTLKFTVPIPTDPAGSFAGGVFRSEYSRDLTGYDAVTFWAKSSAAANLNLVGLGNDNSGNSLYPATTTDLPLSSSWTKYIVPIPNPSRLEREAGMFQIADGADDGRNYEIWMAEVQYEKTGLITNPRPAIPTQTVAGEVGGTADIQGTEVTFDVSGRDMVVGAAPAYFDWTSSDPAVAAVSDAGVIQFIGSGTAEITASLNGTAATGVLSVVSAGPPNVPAPAPEQEADKVTSLFSDAYTDVTVDTWSAEWDDADVEDAQIQGDNVKKYSNAVFAGIEFTSEPVDATERTHVHFDIWVQDDEFFRFKLVDFGPDGAFGGGDDSEHEITLDASSGLKLGEWSIIDVPMSEFAGLQGRSSLAQIIFVPSSSTVYLDNLYFYTDDEFVPPTQPEPTEPAPAPEYDAANVISMFSDVYTDVPVDTWRTEWSVAALQDIEIQGNPTKKYSGLSFVGIETLGTPIDASDMTHFHLDMWTPDPSEVPNTFRVKLVDLGADGTIGTGDDVEHEVLITAETTPALGTEQWLSLDIPLSDFTNLTTRANIGQFILSGDPNTIFVDNVLFRNADGGSPPTPTEPTEPAPVPTFDEGGVISMFSDVYSDVAVDTWRTDWSDATLEDVTIQDDAAKKYSALSFVGIETLGTPIDASEMTHFHLNMWTPDPSETPAAFKVKLVDLGADGTIGTGDDVEHEVSITAESTPALGTGAWLSLDIPLADFTGLTTRAAIGQLILSGDPNTIWVDNVLFRK